MPCFFELVTLILVVLLVHGQDVKTSKYTSITIGKNRTVPLLPQHERDFYSGTIDVDPFPYGSEYTDTIILNFSKPVKVRLTLTKLTWWRNVPCYQTDLPKRVLMGISNEKTFVWKFSNYNETWTEQITDYCRYLEVKRTIFSKSFNVSSLILNKNVTFEANIVAIQLKEVPSNEWCAIQINFFASLLPGNYCQNEEEFYCNESLQCLSKNIRCDGNNDCDLGEDEVNCSHDVSSDLNGSKMLLYGLVGFGSATVMVVIIVVICFCSRRRRQYCVIRSYRSQARENHVYDYPTFSEAAYPLTVQESSESSHKMDLDLDPSSRSHTEIYDESGVYSRVITNK